jgi:hypothetical protein
MRFDAHIGDDPSFFERKKIDINLTWPPNWLDAVAQQGWTPTELLF